MSEDLVFCLQLLHQHGREALIGLHATDVEHGRGTSRAEHEIRRGGTIWDLAIWYVNDQGSLTQYGYWSAGRNGMFNVQQRQQIVAALRACGDTARILHWGGCEAPMLRAAGVPDGVALDGLRVVRFMTGVR